MDTVAYIYQQDGSFFRKMRGQACYMAALGGQKQAVQWLRKHKCEWGASTCTACARIGDAALLAWCREHGAEWDASAYAAAAAGDHVEVLAFLVQEGCPSNAAACKAAAKAGSLAALQFCREKGCLWNADTCAWPPEAAISICWRGRLKMARRSTRAPAARQQSAATCRCCSI
jgi:hypothetical protein